MTLKSHLLSQRNNSNLLIQGDELAVYNKKCYYKQSNQFMSLFVRLRHIVEKMLPEAYKSLCQ